MEESSIENKSSSSRLSRKDFLKISSVGTGAFFISNSLIGEYLENMEPEIPSPKESFSEYKISWEARPWVWINLAIASKLINGRVIQPNEEVSLNDLLKFDEMKDVSRENTDPQKGYIAAQLTDPTKIDGWGYGLCLGSTAIFRAALNSPLLITERGSHYDIYPSYFKDMPIGTDASVFKPDAGDTIPETDLKLKNPTDKPVTLVFKVFNEFGEEIEIPKEEISLVWYKASFLDQIVKVLRNKVKSVSGVELPDQYLPEYAFGNSKIVVQAAICGETVDYDVQLSPVKHGASTIIDGISQYAFTRSLFIKDLSGNDKNFTENFISQYGEEQK